MKNITENIPGGWYGNEPGSFHPKRGNVVVDPEKAIFAVEWLKRRRIKIEYLRPHREIGNDGIAIGYILS